MVEGMEADDGDKGRQSSVVAVAPRAEHLSQLQRRPRTMGQSTLDPASNPHEPSTVFDQTRLLLQLDTGSSWASAFVWWLWL